MSVLQGWQTIAYHMFSLASELRMVFTFFKSCGERTLCLKCLTYLLFGPLQKKFAGCSAGGTHKCHPSHFRDEKAETQRRKDLPKVTQNWVNVS